MGNEILCVCVACAIYLLPSFVCLESQIYEMTEAANAVKVRPSLRASLASMFTRAAPEAKPVEPSTEEESPEHVMTESVSAGHASYDTEGLDTSPLDAVSLGGDPPSSLSHNRNDPPPVGYVAQQPQSGPWL